MDCISPSTREIFYSGLFLATRVCSFKLCVKAALAISFISLVSILLYVSGLFLWAVFSRHGFTSTSDTKQIILGRPLFFPCTLTHSRVSPVKNNFSHRVLFLGVPVGLRGRIQPLLAVDGENVHLAQKTSHTRQWRQWITWFSSDSTRYLQRGDDEGGLREKLDRFLRYEVN